MITYIHSSLFQSPSRVMVNTVNTVGVMGRGIAKTFKELYPEMFRQYQRLCEDGQFGIGQLWLYRTPNKWILNFPTKRHWSTPSIPEYIEKGLLNFRNNYSALGIASIAFPQLGCGNGELDWKTEVKPLMEKYLADLPIPIFIHIYGSANYLPEHHDVEEMKRWLQGRPKDLPYTEVWNELIGTMIDDQKIKKNKTKNSIILPDTKKEINREMFGYLWRSIKEYGYFVKEFTPIELQGNYNEIKTLLLKLPYFKTESIMKINNAGDEISECILRLTPPIKEVQISKLEDFAEIACD